MALALRGVDPHCGAFFPTHGIFFGALCVHVESGQHPAHQEHALGPRCAHARGCGAESSRAASAPSPGPGL